MKQQWAIVVGLLIVGSAWGQMYEVVMPTGGPSYGATSEPTKATVVSNTSNLVTPLAVQPTTGQKQRAFRNLSPVTSDYELEFFEQGFAYETQVTEYDETWGYDVTVYETDENGVPLLDDNGNQIPKMKDTSGTLYSGMGHSLRAAYNWTSANGHVEATAGYQARYLIVDTKSFFTQEDTTVSALNHIISMGGRYIARETETMRLSAGVGVDWVLYSDEYKGLAKEAPTAWNWQCNAVGQFAVGSQTLALGTVLQKTLLKQSHSLDLGVAALWGMPIGARWAFNVDAAYRRTLSAYEELTTGWDSDGDPVQEWEEFDFDQTGVPEPHSLSLGGAATWFVSDRFGLNFGYRTQLLIEDFSSHSLIVGGRFAI